MRRKIAQSMVAFVSAWMVALSTSLMVLNPTAALAATNTAIGDIAGVDADLTDSNTFTMTSQTLALVKRAFDAGGTAIADSSTLAKGSTVKFLIYINNKVDQATNDVSIRDVLAATFQYQAGTLKTSTAVAACALLACTAGEETAIFTDVDGTVAKTDAVDADAVSIAGVTIDAGNQNVANAQLNVPTNKVFALLFTVKLQ